jgi:hypothetical protein
MTKVRSLLFALSLLLWSASAMAGWKRADTPHFRVWADTSDARLRDQAALLEDYRALLDLATGRTLPADSPPLDVFIVDRLAKATPWRSLGPDVAGFYRADAGRISAVARSAAGAEPGTLSGQQILLHEYAHHYMLAQAGTYYPAWYVEGFAEYFATAQFRADRIEFGLASDNRTAWLLTSAWLPLERLLARDPALAGSRDTAMFYAQSWLLTHYMFRVPGMRAKLIAFLADCARGEEPVAAFRLQVDPDLNGFQTKLRRYLETRATYSRFDRPPSTPTSIRITPLPPSADTFLLRQVALEHRVGPDRAGVALAEIRALAAKAPEDPLARRTLALAELEHGDPAVARRLVDDLLAETPADPDLLRWRALALRPLGPDAPPEAMAEARRSLVRAFKIAPNDWRTLHAYARLHRPVAGPLPANVLDVLIRAWTLAPQVTDVVLDTAVALTHADRLAEAAHVLEPLARSPHAGPAAELAARMLAKARSNDRQGLLAEVAAVRLRHQAAAAAVTTGPAAAQR